MQKLYPLSYASAGELANALKELFDGKLSVDKSTNSLIFYGPMAEQKRLQELLQTLDTATKQVTLEAKIVALSQENNKSLGINWNWDTIPQRDVTESDSAEDSDSTDNTFGGNFKFWRGYAFRFNATLNALISKGKAKVLAKPRIITIPGREASIFIGDHIPVQTEKHDSGGYYTATEYLDAGIKLQYLPLISQDGKMVTAKVHTEVSTPVLISELKNYRITSRTADTNVRMFSGQTLVIGGLISEEEQNTLQKIPFLGDLPLLGKLFSNRTKQHTKVEVVLLLTPHITEPGTSPAIFQPPTE
ncbi:MAG: type II secretion system protein GspD [Phascolarctobacterium sp.]